MKPILYVLLTAGLLALTQTGCEAQEAPASKTVPAAPSATERPAAPDLKLTTLDGKAIQISALQGKVVLLDFWATWCPPCRAEIPHFKELYTQYQGQGLEVIGLAMDEEGAAAVGPFAQQIQINYPIALGGSGEAQAYGGIRGIPTTFLIDKQGRIAQKFIGYRSKEVFEKEIRKLLAE